MLQARSESHSYSPLAADFGLVGLFTMSTVSWNKWKPLISVGTFSTSNPLLKSDSRSQKSSHFLATEKLHNKRVYPQLLYLATNHHFVDAGQ